MDIRTDDIVIIDDPVYLWRFQHQESQKEYLIELTNLTPDVQRFDRFELTLPTQLDLEGGKYEYWVYESPETGDEDFTNMRILSVGRLDVEETAGTADKTYQTDEGADTVYKPE